MLVYAYTSSYRALSYYAHSYTRSLTFYGNNYSLIYSQIMTFTVSAWTSERMD